MSTGLSSEINRLKIQTASPTPAPEWSNLSAPKAGVSSHSYNISQRLGSVDMSLDSAASSSDSASRMSVQRGLTPTGATFGAMRTMLDSTAHSVRNASRSPVSTSKPIIDRHGSSGPWVSRSSSVKAPRFGDVSIILFLINNFDCSFRYRARFLAVVQPLSHPLSPLHTSHLMHPQMVRIAQHQHQTMVLFPLRL